MDQHDAITNHYSFGGLRDRIEAGLDRLGPDALPGALSAVDEFHVGGRRATAYLAEKIGFSHGDRVLDLGSGLGGPARFFAAEFGAHVTGVDLTPEYVAVATWLSEMTGWSGSTQFSAGSVLDLGADLVDFDVATMIHVGMNLADKNAVAVAAANALRPGGRFGIYDVMATSDPVQHELPMPWASEASASHVAPASEYVAALEGAGFRVDLIEDRGEQAIAFFDQMQSAPPADGPPPLGLHLVLGRDTPLRIGNMAAAIRSGAISPTVVTATRI